METVCNADTKIKSDANAQRGLEKWEWPEPVTLNPIL